MVQGSQIPAWLRRADDRFISLTKAHGLKVLRWALGVVFVWFGLLKVSGGGPAADLVRETVYWLPPEFVVPALGVLEVAVGVGLISGYAIRLTLGLFFFQMAGTFLVLIIRPEQAFESSNPLQLTLVGEFVVKNLVLLAAGLAIAGRVRKPASEHTLGEMVKERAD